MQVIAKSFAGRAGKFHREARGIAVRSRKMQGRKIVVDQKTDRPKAGEVRPLKLDPRIPEVGNGDLSPRLS